MQLNSCKMTELRKKYHHEVLDTHTKKISRLLFREKDVDEHIINISSYNLDFFQKLVLCRGLDFAIPKPVSAIDQFKCDLCDAGYVGFTRRHLHQRVDEHRHTSSSIGKHFRDKHSSTPKDLTSNFTILKKCNSKFDCLIYEMFFY